MKKILNKKLITILIIALLLITGLILMDKIFKRINTYYNPMISSNLTKDYRKNFISLSQNSSEKNLSNNYEIGLKLIKKGNAKIEVEKDKFNEKFKKLIELASFFDGNLINSEIYKENDINSGYFTFMIPSKNFDNFLNKLVDIGEVKNLSISTKDVTEEYFDLEGKLKILEAQRNLLLSWLEKTKEIKDLILIRSELQNIETEIEKIKGRMKYINYHSEYSEVNIFLIEKKGKIPLWEKSEIFKKLINGLKFAINSIINSVINLIIFLAIITPWIIFVYLIFFIIKKYFIKSKK